MRWLHTQLLPHPSTQEQLPSVQRASLPSPEQGTHVCNLRMQPCVKGTGHGYKFGKKGLGDLEQQRSEPTSHAAVPLHVLSGMCL